MRGKQSQCVPQQLEEDEALLGHGSHDTSMGVCVFFMHKWEKGQYVGSKKEERGREREKGLPVGRPAARIKERLSIVTDEGKKHSDHAGLLGWPLPQ